jgi:hypothetical protein
MSRGVVQLDREFSSAVVPPLRQKAFRASPLEFSLRTLYGTVATLGRQTLRGVAEAASQILIHYGNIESLDKLRQLYTAGRLDGHQNLSE